MFQSIAFTKNLGYDEKTKIQSLEYDLTDSDFGCVEVVVDGSGDCGFDGEVEAVIQEYTKRNLNVAYNLVKLFLYYEEETGHSIADQIEFAQKHSPLFTPELKADIEKYLTLI